jgi:hypothetical protein
MKTTRLRFIMVAFAVILLVGVTGCDQRSATPNQPAVEASPAAVATHAEPLQIEAFLELLRADGFQVGDRREKFYQLLMASDGAAFDVDGHTIEVYEFDVSIRTGREALERLNEDGFVGGSMQIHKNLALVVHGDNPAENRIQRLFESL